MLGIVPAVALNAVVAEPAGTVTDEPGTGNKVLLLDRETDVPPVGAVWLKVTVHVVAAAEARLVGLQLREESVTGAVKLIVAVCEAPLSVAVSVAL